MVPATRGAEHEAVVMNRLIDSRLASLRAGCSPGGCGHVAVAMADQVAANLHELVDDTHRSSATDRARVRAAVHLFHGLGRGGGLTRPRTLPHELRKINDVVRPLGARDVRAPASIAGCPLFENDEVLRRRCPMFQRTAA
jgi:hypothetical protein